MGLILRASTCALGPLMGSLPAAATEPLKIAFVCVDPVGDSGWTCRHDLARRAPELAGRTTVSDCGHD
jgi:simple sugar transport system substrate-binding protein